MAKKIRIRSPKKIHQRFLSLGFFPPELPNCFFSKEFGSQQDFLSAQFAKIADLKNGNPDYYNFKSDRTDIYFPRFGHEHRKHSVINPVNFFFLSKILSDNWSDIKNKINKSKYSSSKPIFDPTDDRAIIRPNFDSRDKFELYVSSIDNYILQTDVSRYFHSIYSHSIAWAVHGKSYAKKHRTAADYGNAIDLLVRNSQDGQTIGLPVGPDTSRVISELIGSAVDVELRKLLPRKTEAIRFVDDYIIGSATREIAERNASHLRRVLGEYELDINHRKTKIVATGVSNLNGWKEEIRSIAPKVPFGEAELERFFYNVDAIARRESEKNVYHFALSRLRFSFLRNAEWQPIEERLLSIARIDGSLIAPTCDILITRNRINPILDKEKIHKFLISNLKRFVDLRRYGEAVWILHTLICMALSVRSSVVRPLFAEENPFVAILLCDMKERGLLEGAISRLTWNGSLTAEGLHSSMWLYAYEGSLKSYTKKKNVSFISSHNYFKHLFSKKISFYQSGGASLSLRELMAKSAHTWQVRKNTLDFGEDLEMDQDWEFENIGDDDDTYSDEYV